MSGAGDLMTLNGNRAPETRSRARTRSLLARTRGRSLRELIDRARQMALITLGRAGLDRGWDEPTPQQFVARECVPGTTQREVVERLCVPGAPGWAPGLQDLEAVVGQLREVAPGAEGELLADAQQILTGRFALLGYRALSFGRPVDWHLDPVSGRRAEPRHWSRVPFLAFEEVGDHKVIWELNRHQHLVRLGQAYCLTGDEGYAGTIADHASSWMDANPPQLGINWASSLELALRSIAWLWALRLAGASPAMSRPLVLRMAAMLARHGRHIERHLSTYFSPNTHLTGEALGLLYLGTALPVLRDAARWRELGWRIFRQQMQRQVLPDGVYFEQTTCYHRYTTEFLLHAVMLADAERRCPEVWDTLDRLFTFLVHLQQPNGRTPMIGDDDGGRVLILQPAAGDDFRATLAVGAALLARGDLAWAAGNAWTEVPWLLGTAGVRSLKAVVPTPPAHSSRAFPAGGYYVMRDGWHPPASMAVIDAGDLGSLSAGHAHADALGIHLVIRDIPVLVDAGTYTYSASIQARNRFRGGAGHSVLLLDGQGSAIPAEAPFRWRSRVRATANVWVTHRRFDVFTGSHDGFTRLPQPARYRRTIMRLAEDYWVVHDHVESSGSHRSEIRYRWAPGLGVAGAANGDHVVTDAEGRTLVRLAVAPDTHRRILDEELSPAYGMLVPARTSVVGPADGTAADILSVLAPGDATVTVARIDGGHRIERGDAQDVVLTGRCSGSGEHAIETDGDWCWVRLSPDGSPVEIVATGVRALRVGGEAIAPDGPPVPWLYARRDVQTWLVEAGEV